MILKFNEYIKENDGGGVAYATASNTGGMGAVVAPQPSSIPGDVAGSTKGSGDLPAYDMGKKFDFPYKGKKKGKKKKKKDHSELGEDYRNMYVTKFSNWKYYPEKKMNEMDAFFIRPVEKKKTCQEYEDEGYEIERLDIPFTSTLCIF
jgi:hypothetical protein